MMNRKLILTIALSLPAFFAFAGSGNGSKVEIGKPLPTWSEGCLDIHAINSARGECTFIIMPDGTTMTVDAGEFSSESPRYRNDIQRPDTLTRPSRLYSEYMKYFSPEKDSTDYFLLSHFHMDHMGNIEKEYSKDKEGGYVLSGMTALYDEMPYRKVIDRAYPDFDSLACLSMSTAALDNYRKFLDYETKNGTLKAEGFKLGSDSQIVLSKNPAKYPDFKVMNICGNGCVWVDGKPVDCYNKPHKENAASCGVLISYGDFDYFTAGDAGGDSKGTPNIEVLSAKAIGKEIEAIKAHHHLSPRTMQQETMDILNPDVIVTQSFYIREIQPDQEIIARILGNGDTKMYFTNIDESLIKANPEAYSKCTAIGGHVVIRVMPGGKQFYVYVLDDTDLSFKVKQIDGPFNCKVN